MQCGSSNNQKLAVTLLEIEKAIRSRPTVTEPQNKFLANQDIEKEIIDMIERTRWRISIISPWISEVLPIVRLKEMVNYRRWISARIFTRPLKFYDDKRKVLLKQIHLLGAQIETNKEIHAKMVIIDSDEMVVMSANLIPSSMERNDEVALWTRDKVAINCALYYFDDLMCSALERRITN